MIQAIYDYFRECPLIEDKKLSVDFLGHEGIEYAIDVPPFESMVKPYKDGGALKQFVFIFGSREYYGADVMQNLENSGFYNQMTDWIKSKNKLKELPELGNKKNALRIDVDTPGYLFGATEDTARYQIQMKLVYYESF